jgi:hypothetical protein
LLQLSDSFLLTRISNLQLSIHLLSPCYCRLGFLKVLLTSTLSLLPQHHARHLTSSRITTIQDPICLLLIHTFYQATITTSTLRIFQAASQQVFTHLLTRKTTISHFAIPHHITCTVKMVNFTAFITLIMGITTFFTDKLLVARVFTWSQKLIAAPPKCTPTHLDGYEELFTLVSPVTVLKTLTTATINMTADLPTFTTIITPPGTDLALFTGTITTTSFLSLAKEFVCATLTVPAPLTANAASLVTAFLFGTILLLATVGFVASSPTVMKAEDLAYLESRLAEKGELAKSLRRSNANEAAYLRREMRFMRMGADKLLATTLTKHNSAITARDREIHQFRQNLAGADLREEQTRFKSSDEVINLRKEIGHLRTVIDDLDQRLEETGAVAVAEEAQEKVKVAEERALAAAQQALEANQKVEAAEKAHKEKIIAEQKRGQVAVDEVKAKASRLSDLVRIEEYKVQDLRKELKELKELKAGVVGVAPVPTQPILVCKSSTTVAEEMRARIETAVDSASGASSVPEPEPAAVALPAAVAPAPVPKPLAHEEQKRVPRRPARGPFPDWTARKVTKR